MTSIPAGSSRARHDYTPGKPARRPRSPAGETAPSPGGDAARVLVPVGLIVPVLAGLARNLRGLRIELADDGSLILVYDHPPDGRTCLGGDVFLSVPAEAAEAFLAALGAVRAARVGPHLLLAVLLSLREASAAGRPWYRSDAVSLADPRAAQGRGEHRSQLVRLVEAWAVILEAAHWTIDVRTRRSRVQVHLEAVPLVRHPRPGRGYDVKLSPELHRLLDRPARRVPARLLQLDTLAVGGGRRRASGVDLFYARLALIRHLALRATASSRRSRDLSVRELLAQAGGITVEAIDQAGLWRAWAAELLADLDAAGLLRHYPAELDGGRTVITPQAIRSRPPRPANVIELAPIKVARATRARARARAAPVPFDQAQAQAETAHGGR